MYKKIILCGIGKPHSITMYDFHPLNIEKYNIYLYVIVIYYIKYNFVYVLIPMQESFFFPQRVQKQVANSVIQVLTCSRNAAR